MSPYLIAGVLSGMAGLLVFLVIHHFWISPIWFIAPIGMVIAGLGGLAVGWSYAEIHASLPPRPWTALALFLLISLILAPSIILAQLRTPLIDIGAGTIPPDRIGQVGFHFVIELLLPAVIVGGLAGWFLGQSRQAVFATALAGFVYALGPGHNIPFLGNTLATGKGLALLFAITLVSVLVLVETSSWLAKQ